MNMHTSIDLAAAPRAVPQLLALGEQLREAYEIEINTEKTAPTNIDLDRFPPYMEAYNRCKGLVTQIEAIPPVTFQDFGVKMLAVAWAQGTDALVAKASQAESADARILESIVPAVLNATGLMPFAAPAPEAPREPFSINWPAIERGLATIVADINALDREIAMRSKAFATWEFRNPYPTEPEYDSHRARIDDFDRMNKALAAHAIRYQNALIQCGRAPFQKRRLELFERYDAECEHIASLPTPSHHDVKQKVRIARMEPDGGPIHQALFDHLSGNA